MKNKSRLIGGLGAIVLSTFLGCVHNTELETKNFSYHGVKGHITSKHYHYGKNNEPIYCQPIYLDNGDIINEGSITTDNNEKITVFISD